MSSDNSRQEGQTETPSVAVQVGPPPAYGAPADEQNLNAASNPPAYDVATKLPSYDEAERSKAAEAGLIDECPDRAARQARRANRSFFFWGGPGQWSYSSRVDPQTLSHAQLQQQVLGSELEFLCCFLVALLFNWIGLFAALCCLTVTIAGRAGAISGFGLSVVKWGFLVMHQSYITRDTFGLSTGVDNSATYSTGGTVNDESDSKWFTISCWLIVALGFLCFLQGVVHYIRAKRAARDYNWLRQQYNSQLF